MQIQPTKPLYRIGYRDVKIEDEIDEKIKGDTTMTQTDPHTENIEQRSGYTIEELQVIGEQLLGRVKELVHEGNVRRIIIKQEGNTILEIPLTFGIAGILVAPVWAAIGVLGALLAQCSIEVVRSEPPAETTKTNVEEVSPETPE
jgi:hypothetical protein